MQLENRLGMGRGHNPAANQSGERVVLELVSKTAVRSPIVVFDVGSNQGQYAGLAKTVLGSHTDFEFHCFEPSRSTFDILSSNLQVDKRFKLNPFGLAEEARNASLFMNEVGSGLASLTQRRLDHFQIDHGRIQEQVALQTIGEYCARNEIQQIDLLKIDVEGHELDVLAGGRSMLEDHRISLIQFEFGGCNIDTRTYFQDFYYMLDSIGFQLFRILPNASLLRIADYRETDEKFRTTNYLAASRSIDVASMVDCVSR